MLLSKEAAVLQFVIASINAITTQVKTLLELVITACRHRRHRSTLDVAAAHELFPTDRRQAKAVQLRA